MNKERWQKLGLAKQLGNIASEINRAKYWKEKSENAEAKKSLERALDLLGLSIDCHPSPGRRDLTRFYEVLASHYADQNTYPITLTSLEDFCLSHL